MTAAALNNILEMDFPNNCNCEYNLTVITVMKLEATCTYFIFTTIKAQNNIPQNIPQSFFLTCFNTLYNLK